jgi:hypothetical protein
VIESGNRATPGDSLFSAQHVAGEPAPKRGKWEIIGPAECPILLRRTLAACRFGKLLLHEFMPNATDGAFHDHPASFLTFVLHGGYTDVTPEGKHDHVNAPTVRFRRAEHAHITEVGVLGCTTFVVMFRKRRDWGFFRDDKWYEWRRFERLFGLNWRCP